MSRKTCINTGNLHVGGGVQVAASVLEELAALPGDTETPQALISSEVAKQLSPLAIQGLAAKGLTVLDVFGFDLFKSQARRVMDRYATVLTVFGPLYRWHPPFTSIVGFAQPWIIYPQNECYAVMPFFSRLKSRLKFWLQSQFFKRADVLVVELEHVKDGLIRELGIDPERIHVVHNCISALYGDEARWLPIRMPTGDGALRLGFLGRNYLHKNTVIFPDIVARLRECHGIIAKFYVTFTDAEWRACSPAFREASINLGPLKATQCPSFYQQLDAVVFPSLLECFSATPLEAMAMEKPLFASDRPFNHDICGNHAWYFDPLSPTDAADKIARMFKSGGPETSALTAAREHAVSFSKPAVRAEKYLALLGQIENTSAKD